MSFTKVKDKVNLNKLYLSFNILKLEDIFEIEIGKFIYLQYNNLLPEGFADNFTLVLKSHNCNTENTVHLQKLLHFETAHF